MKNSQIFIFPDEALIETREHMTRFMGQPVKHSEPIIKADRSTDQYGASWATVLYDKEENVFKAWYTARTRNIERLVGDPLEDNEAPNYLAYAISKDGINFNKPTLKIVEYNKSKMNNLCDTTHANGLIKDLVEEDPKKLYKRFMYNWTDRTLHMKFSEDGLNWSWPTQKKPLFKSWKTIHDTHSLMGWDESTHQYVSFLRPYISSSFRKRKIGISTTNNILDWPDPKIILEADDFDPHWKSHNGNDVGMDLYHMEGFKYGESYLGMLNVFDAHFSGEFNDRMYVSLASSSDLYNWQRTLRSCFLGTGNPGDFDGGMVFITSPPITYQDQIYIYYSAYPHFHVGYMPGHHATREKMYSSIGLAKLRLDGFCGFYTNPYQGHLITKPIRITGDQILVNCIPNAAHKGWLKLELLDEEGNIIKGYSKEDCEALTEDSLYGKVAWKSKKSLAELKGRNVKFSIYQWESIFYAFRIISY